MTALEQLAPRWVHAWLRRGWLCTLHGDPVTPRLEGRLRPISGSLDGPPRQHPTMRGQNLEDDFAIY